MIQFFRFCCLAFCAFLLMACGTVPTQQAAGPETQRQGLATAWAETRQSGIRDVSFERADPDKPTDMVAVYYNNGLAAGRGAVRTLLMDAKQVELQFQFPDNGAGLRDGQLRRDRNGRWNLSGKAGDRYEIVLRNRGPVAYMAVVTVDGLDVISGRPGSYNAGGYIVGAGSTVVIDGFRKNKQEVAAFRFSSVDQSYAANSPQGDTANVGVIGVALFAEKDSPETELRRNANPFPQNENRYAPPPRM